MEPERILDSRIVKNKMQYLVRWKNESKPTWEQRKKRKLKPLIEKYEKMINGDIEHVPVEFRKRDENVKIVLRDKLLPMINGEVYERTEKIPTKYGVQVLTAF